MIWLFYLQCCYKCVVIPLQIRQIRKKMFDIINREVTTSDLKEVVSKLIPDSMSLDIQVIHINLTLNKRSK